jgi:hypothetical protein
VGLGFSIGANPFPILSRFISDSTRLSPVRLTTLLPPGGLSLLALPHCRPKADGEGVDSEMTVNAANRRDNHSVLLRLRILARRQTDDP